VKVQGQMLVLRVMRERVSRVRGIPGRIHPPLLCLRGFLGFLDPSAF